MSHLKKSLKRKLQLAKKCKLPVHRMPRLSRSRAPSQLLSRQKRRLRMSKRVLHRLRRSPLPRLKS